MRFITMGLNFELLSSCRRLTWSRLTIVGFKRLKNTYRHVNAIITIPVGKDHVDSCQMTNSLQRLLSKCEVVDSFFLYSCSNYELI